MGLVAQGDQGGQAAAQQGAIGLQGVVPWVTGTAVPCWIYMRALRSVTKKLPSVTWASSDGSAGGREAGCAGALGVRCIYPWGSRWIAAASWAARSPVALSVYPSPA